MISLNGLGLQSTRQILREPQDEAGATVTDLGRMTGRSHVAVLRALDRARNRKDEETEH